MPPVTTTVTPAIVHAAALFSDAHALILSHVDDGGAGEADVGSDKVSTAAALARAEAMLRLLAAVRTAARSKDVV